MASGGDKAFSVVGRTGAGMCSLGFPPQPLTSRLGDLRQAVPLSGVQSLYLSDGVTGLSLEKCLVKCDPR